MVSRVLVVNAGSSSLRLTLLDGGDATLASHHVAAGEDWEAALGEIVDGAEAPDAAGHRVVHGGERFAAARVIDSEVERELEALEELAPLHNPPAIAMIRALRELRPALPSVACFDTAFHRSLPPAASAYAIPASWRERWPLRRFGFHGLSHNYVSRRAAELVGRPRSELRVVTAHLGAGASLAAVAGGKSVDTTMGFTPLEGLVMATRSGSVDPGLLLWVQRHGGLDPDALEAALETESGLLGLSGRSSSLGELLDSAAAGDQRCAEAIDVYLHRLRAGIAAMAAAMGGLDALVFSGGVGEGSPEVRERTCDGLGFLGLAIDAEANRSATEDDRDLSGEGAGARVLLVHTREDLEIASQVRTALGLG